MGTQTIEGVEIVEDMVLNNFLLFLLLLLSILFYFLPTFFAFLRKHPSKFGILVINFFLGWTFLGWIISLAWALSRKD